MAFNVVMEYKRFQRNWSIYGYFKTIILPFDNRNCTVCNAKRFIEVKILYRTKQKLRHNNLLKYDCFKISVKIMYFKENWLNNKQIPYKV